MNLFRNNAMAVVSQSITALLAWLFLFPLTLFIPRNTKRFLVIGRNSKYFTDNSKHFFLFLSALPAAEAEPIFLTRDRATCDLLRNAGLATVFFPGWQAVVQLLTAGYIVVDNADWIEQGKFQLSRGAKIVQLWHGAPLKEIELPLRDRSWQQLPAPLRSLLRIQKKITGRYSPVDFLISTSQFFTDRAFRPAFHSRCIVNSGYPRNDAILHCASHTEMADPVWLNTDQAIISRLLAADSRQGKQVKKILYAPTFRNSMASPFTEDILDLDRLDRFAEENNCLFVMKLHPLMEGSMDVDRYQHILSYAPLADIYPALSFFDVLITDYSSIYFDFLILDRPIIFFPYDYDAYLQEDRKLLFDYQQMAPGTICSCQQEVEQALLSTDGGDKFREQRKEVQRLVFDTPDGKASQRLWQAIKGRKTDNILS